MDGHQSFWAGAALHSFSSWPSSKNFPNSPRTLKGREPRHHYQKIVLGSLGLTPLSLFLEEQCVTAQRVEEKKRKKRGDITQREKMDAAALRNRIQATLDANADVRRQAELDLRNVWTFLECAMRDGQADGSDRPRTMLDSARRC